MVWFASLVACTVHAEAVATACPDLAGHYRVDGFGPVLADALKATGLSMAGFRDSEVRITGAADTALSFWVKSGRSSPMSSQPLVVLTRGVNYDCDGGNIVLKHKVQSSRQGDEAWLEGQSIVRLYGDGRGGLMISAEFFGRERTTLYSYDSARVSVPKLGTGQSMSEAIRWPNIREPRPLEQTYVAPVESDRVKAVRAALTASVLGSVNLGGLQDSGEQVLASLNAPKSDEVVAFEDRLRAAGIAYRMLREPVWSANSWSMQALIATGAAAAAWQPSGFRVQHELERMQHPMVYVRAVEAGEDGYVATLEVDGPTRIEDIVKRIRQVTTMFATIELLDEAPRADAPRIRLVRLRLSVG
jgi:hypothetical protein